jgi:hypothetical protein
METGRKTQIRIIKQGIAGNIPESQASPVSRERPKKDPMAEFKERRRPDPRITFFQQMIISYT